MNDDFSRDIKRLSKLLEEVKELFQNMVDSRWLLLREELRKPVFDAWSEVQLIFDDLQKEFDTPSRDLRESLRERLGQAGLLGKQLDLKETAIELSWKDFKQWGTVKLLKKVLDLINSFLESLFKALPGGHAIKEFKDFFELGIEEDGNRFFEQQVE